MKKIYFAPNWGLSPEAMVDDYIKQTPACAGIWNNIKYTLEPAAADYLIIQDQCDKELMNMFERKQRLYFSREATTPHVYHQYPPSIVRRYSFWDDTGILWTKWCYPPGGNAGINKSYDDLIEESPVGKTKKLSCIQSDKRDTAGHKLRHNFLGRFIKDSSVSLDLYGKICYANCVLQDDNKCFGLNDYKYVLTFDNQNTIAPFFGTQFTDAILRWAIPLYWGGGAIEKYFPTGSFIKIDIENPDEIENISHFIDQDDYFSRLTALAQARTLILNKYNLWPVIEAVINEGII